MSISTAAAGIRITSAAKESAGAASTLPSPATSAADDVIVPDAITVNNEGNLDTSPSYVGRMFALRPWEMKLILVEILDPGSGYTAADVLTLSGGTAGPGGAPQVTVATVGGSPEGQVQSVTISREASFAIRRAGMTGAPSPPNNNDSPLGTAVTGGTGSGARFRCVYAPHFELRLVIADASNTLTVHEPWDVPPVSGDNWAVSYILEDPATLTGLGLIAKTGVFEATRRIFIGDSPDTARHAWLAINDGKALEVDNIADNSLAIVDGGILTIGQVSGGESVNGGYLSSSGTTGAEIDFQTEVGGFFIIHDLQIRSPRENLQFGGGAVGSFDADTRLFREQVGAIIKRVKFLDVADVLDLSGYRLRDAVVQATATQTFLLNPAILLDESSGIAGTSTANLNRVTWLGLGNAAGLRTLRATFTDAVILDFLRNMIFLQPAPTDGRFVQVEENETWQFVNPVWALTLSGASVSFDFNSETASLIEELMSLIIRPVTAAGVAIPDVVGYIYEGVIGDNLPSENTNRSVVAAYDPIADKRFEDEILPGAVVYFSDVLNNVYTAGSPLTTILQAARGSFAFRGYLYGKQPLVNAFAANLNKGLDLQLAMLPDDVLVNTTASAALALSPEPLVTRHHPDVIDQSPQLWTDTQRMIAFNYDGGNGSVPAVGATVTNDASPQAVGTVADHIGDGVTGTLLIENWNGGEFTDGGTLTEFDPPEVTLLAEQLWDDAGTSPLITNPITLDFAVPGGSNRLIFFAFSATFLASTPDYNGPTGTPTIDGNALTLVANYPSPGASPDQTLGFFEQDWMQLWVLKEAVIAGLPGTATLSYLHTDTTVSPNIEADQVVASIFSTDGVIQSPLVSAEGARQRTNPLASPVLPFPVSITPNAINDTIMGVTHVRREASTNSPQFIVVSKDPAVQFVSISAPGGNVNHQPVHVISTRTATDLVGLSPEPYELEVVMAGQSANSARGASSAVLLERLSTFSGAVNRSQSPEFYETYTWLVDVSQQTVNDAYDWLAAKMAENPVDAQFEEVIKWGGDDSEATQLMFSGTGGFFTNRAVRGGQSAVMPQVAASFTISDFEDSFDFGSQPSPDQVAANNPGVWLDFSSVPIFSEWTYSTGVTGEAIGNPGSNETAVLIVDPLQHDFADNQSCYGQFGGATSEDEVGKFYGVVLRSNGTKCYVGGRMGDGTGFVKSCILKVDFTTSPATVDVLAETSQFAVGSSFTAELHAYGSRLVYYEGSRFPDKDPTLEVWDNELSGGQPGIIHGVASAGTSSALECDFVKFIDLSNELLVGEGVWITNRAVGQYDFFTSDEGQRFEVPATVTLSVVVIDSTLSPRGLASIPVRIEQPEPGGVGPNTSLIAEGVTNALGIFAVPFSYTVDVPVDIIVRSSSIVSPLSRRYLAARQGGTITLSGLAQEIRLIEDPNADNEN